MHGEEARPAEGGPPDLFACRLTLRPERPGALLPGSGRAVQAAWLHWVRQVDPALAGWLHEGSERRPYTCSPLHGLPQAAPGTLVPVTPERTYDVRLSGFDAAVVARLVALIDTPPSHLVLADVPFALVEAMPDEETPPTTFAALAARHLLPTGATDGPQADVTLHFQTATSFRQSEGPAGRPAPIPFPLPALVWGGLYDRWGTVAPIRLDPALREVLTTRVAVSRFEGASQRVLVPGLGEPDRRVGATGGRWTVGFVGRCTYWWPRRDGYLGGVLCLLAAFAAYSGVGHGTAYGLGQVRASVERDVARGRTTAA